MGPILHTTKAVGKLLLCETTLAGRLPGVCWAPALRPPITSWRPADDPNRPLTFTDLYDLGTKRRPVTDTADDGSAAEKSVRKDFLAEQ